jgi:hypothetical protein
MLVPKAEILTDSDGATDLQDDVDVAVTQEFPASVLQGFFWASDMTTSRMQTVPPTVSNACDSEPGPASSVDVGVQALQLSSERLPDLVDDRSDVQDTAQVLANSPAPFAGDSCDVARASALRPLCSIFAWRCACSWHHPVL